MPPPGRHPTRAVADKRGPDGLHGRGTKGLECVRYTTWNL
jgi:hypothetical protein